MISIVGHELLLWEINVAALCDTQLAPIGDSAEVCAGHIAIRWMGMGQEEPKETGVGICPSLLVFQCQFSAVSRRVTH